MTLFYISSICASNKYYVSSRNTNIRGHILVQLPMCDGPTHGDDIGDMAVPANGGRGEELFWEGGGCSYIHKCSKHFNN